MDSAFRSTADGVVHRLRVNSSLLGSDLLQPLQVVDAEQTVIPEDAPCYVLFPTTEDLPAGAPQQKVKQAWERLGEGKNVSTCKGASSVHSLALRCGHGSHTVFVHRIYSFPDGHLSYPCCGAT